MSTKEDEQSEAARTNADRDAKERFLAAEKLPWYLREPKTQRRNVMPKYCPCCHQSNGHAANCPNED